MNSEERENFLVAGPVLVAEAQIYDLAAVRRRRERVRESEMVTESGESRQCVDRVCVLAWRPRRPQGDVA
jgi:hypothetical protein